MFIFSHNSSLWFSFPLFFIIFFFLSLFSFFFFVVVVNKFSWYFLLCFLLLFIQFSSFNSISSYFLFLSFHHFSFHHLSLCLLFIIIFFLFIVYLHCSSVGFLFTFTLSLFSSFLALLSSSHLSVINLSTQTVTLLLVSCYSSFIFIIPHLAFSSTSSLSLFPSFLALLSSSYLSEINLSTQTVTLILLSSYSSYIFILPHCANSLPLSLFPSFLALPSPVLPLFVINLSRQTVTLP